MAERLKIWFPKKRKICCCGKTVQTVSFLTKNLAITTSPQTQVNQSTS